MTTLMFILLIAGFGGTICSLLAIDCKRDDTKHQPRQPIKRWDDPTHKSGYGG